MHPSHFFKGKIRKIMVAGFVKTRWRFLLRECQSGQMGWTKAPVA